MIVVAVPLVALWLLAPQQYVEVKNRETGEEYYALDAEEGDTVRLSWTHSIEHTPWVELYEISDGQLQLREVHVKSFGAGVDQIAPEVENRDGWVMMRGYERSFPALHFFQSRDVDRELVVNGREAELDGRVPQYAAVEVKPEQTPIILRWLEKL